MAKKSSAIDQERAQVRQERPSREEIDAALARLEKIAQRLPPVDAVAIVREGRDASARSR